MVLMPVSMSPSRRESVTVWHQGHWYEKEHVDTTGKLTELSLYSKRLSDFIGNPKLGLILDRVVPLTPSISYVGCLHYGSCWWVWYRP